MPTAEGRKQVGWNQGGTRVARALEILEILETRDHVSCCEAWHHGRVLEIP